MAQADYAWAEQPDLGTEPARLALSVSIFADRPHIRAAIRDDALAAGLRVSQCGELAVLLENEAIGLGELVLIDCPQIDGARLAALARLDIRAARTDAQLVVSTGIEALDDVFACLDQSQAQILVDPGRAERMVALGRVLGRAVQLRLRELSEEDRLQLLRITQQVEEIARRLDHLGFGGPGASPPEGGALQLEAPAQPFFGEPANGAQRAARALRPPLPDPRLVRRIIRQRQLRGRFFDGELFADPAWDMLLDLTAARAEHGRVSVTSLCIASGVPPTTALRWIGQMTEAGLLARIEDETDRRRAFIVLTDMAAEAMARYFAELGSSAAQMV